MTTLTEDERAECRNCGMLLRGKPYYMGGSAYHPLTGEQCKVNHYGGFVCSPGCDYRASVKQVSSMPGCAGATRPDCYAMERLRRNWPGHYV